MFRRLPRRPGTALGLAIATLLTLAGVPGGAAAQPRDVKVGAFVSSLSDINPSDGNFRVVLYAWFSDPAGRFNVERDLYLIARTASIDAIDTEPAPGGGSYTYARIEAEVPQEFAHRHFPFDRQRLTVRMEASESVNDLRFVPDHEDTGASDYLPLFGWTLDGVSIDVQEHAYDSGFGFGKRQASWSTSGQSKRTSIPLWFRATRSRWSGRPARANFGSFRRLTAPLGSVSPRLGAKSTRDRSCQLKPIA